MNSSSVKYFYLIAILLVAAYLRLGNLGVSSFWVDELDFVYAAKSEMETGEPLLNSGYAYPRAMLYTYSIIASFKLFGISEFSSRLSSAIFGIVCVWLMYVVGKGWFNARVGMLSALFLALSPFAIGWSRTARMYTLFQLLFIAAAYLLYRGFESENENPESASPRKNILDRIKFLHQDWGLSYWYLAAGAFVLYLSFTTHELAGLYALSFFIYLFVIGVAVVIANGKSAAAKYLGTLGVTSIATIFAFAVLPPLQDKIREGLEFLPKWAEVSAAQNKLRLIDYLMSEEFVPLNGFFIIGAVHALTQAKKAGVYLLSLLAAPLALFTFVFSFQKNSYIFHIFPVIILFAAYALDRLMNFEFAESSLSAWLDKINFSKIRTPVMTGLLLAWLPITFGFRLALSTPRQVDGQYNGAVYHAEWREAAEYVRDNLQEGDAVMSTLPQTVQYYLGRADYNLNWPNADLARQHNIIGKDGRLIDYYSGAEIIEDLPELQRIIESRARGWLIVDAYRFEEPVYVPREIRQFLEQRLTREFETKRKTMTVFSWKRAPAAL
jgi:hypothetical protein